MKPAIRTALSLLPLVLQFSAMASAWGGISFAVLAVTGFIKKHEGKLDIPEPTQLLVEHSSAAKLIVVGFFAVSVLTFLITRLKVKEETDRLIIQNAVYGFVWCFAVTYVGGVLMAAVLPYLPFLNRP